MDRWTKFVMELEHYRDKGNLESYFKVSRQEYIQRLINICHQHTKIFKIDYDLSTPKKFWVYRWGWIK